MALTQESCDGIGVFQQEEQHLPSNSMSQQGLQILQPSSDALKGNMLLVGRPHDTIHGTDFVFNQTIKSADYEVFESSNMVDLLWGCTSENHRCPQCLDELYPVRNSYKLGCIKTHNLGG